jgi:Tfp pilus assembly protein PilP
MKQQKQLIALAVLVVVAAVAWVWSSRQSPHAAAASTVVSTYSAMNVDNPAIQWPKIARVQKTEYKPIGRNPFSDVPLPPPPAKIPQPGETGYVAPAPPPPQALELPPNMKFFGYGTIPNGTARRAFLTDGDEVYIVAEGDMFLGRFRILKIGNATIEFEETSSGRRGTSNIEDAGPTA